MSAAPSRPQPYRGPYPIRSHRTLAELGFGDPATLRPVVIGLDLGRGPDIHVEQVVQVVEGQHRVIGQRFCSGADVPPREDPRDLQRQWDAEAQESFAEALADVRAQFRAVNTAMQRPKPDQPPTVMALVIGIGSAIAGAALIAGVVSWIAIVVAVGGGQ